VLECVVKLQKPGTAYDLDSLGARPRAHRKQKDSGKAKVRVHIEDKTLDFDSWTRNSVVAMDFHGRWPAGAPFLKKPAEDHKPIGELNFLVVSGKADLVLAKKNSRSKDRHVPVQHASSVEGPLKLKQHPQLGHPALNPPETSRPCKRPWKKLRRNIADQGVVRLSPKAQESNGDGPSAKWRSSAPPRSTISARGRRSHDE